MRGKVSFNGVAMSMGSINFIPTHAAPGRSFAFGRVTNGMYEVNGLGSGEYRVAVNSPEGSYDAKYEVTGIPCLILFKAGEPVDRIVGYVPEKMLVTMVEKHLAPAA